jgi:hypothetical protein
VTTAALSGLEFTGDGYVILNKDNFKPTAACSILFNFRTLAPDGADGLMFLMGTPNKDFLSLEIKDGKVVAQFDLGSGAAYLTSQERFNDGQWHSVYMNRYAKDGILKIDGVTGRCLCSHIIVFFLPSPRLGVGYCIWVCLSVCLSVRAHNSNTINPIGLIFLPKEGSVHGSVLFEFGLDLDPNSIFFKDSLTGLLVSGCLVCCFIH